MDGQLAELEQTIVEGPGMLDPVLRRAAFAGGHNDLPEPLAAYVDTVRRHAYRVTDAQVSALHAAGYSDDQIFEATIAAAAGAGMHRIRAGLAALEESPAGAGAARAEEEPA